MEFYHVDVFSENVLSGNGLTVLLVDEFPDKTDMQRIAEEMKQFETIFVKRMENNVFHARIFTVEEELDFAGHPILGAVSVIHERFFENETKIMITFQLAKKQVETISEKKNGHYSAKMNQGLPVFGQTLDDASICEYAKLLNLQMEDLCSFAPMEIVSTGLPYLLVPVRRGIDHAKILCTDFEQKLEKNGAKFVYVFDVENMEGRTWDNLGIVEDVATGSAAGPMGAYLYKYGYFKENMEISIHQGRFVGRPSILTVSKDPLSGEINVAGDVALFAKGHMYL